eukprot:gene8895-biopygen4556
MRRSGARVPLQDSTVLSCHTANCRGVRRSNAPLVGSRSRKSVSTTCIALGAPGCREPTNTQSKKYHHIHGTHTTIPCPTPKFGSAFVSLEFKVPTLDWDCWPAEKGFLLLAGGARIKACPHSQDAIELRQTREWKKKEARRFSGGRKSTQNPWRQARGGFYCQL